MGFFQKIAEGIRKTKDAFSKKLFFAFSAREFDDEFYEHLEEALLTAGFGSIEDMVDGKLLLFSFFELLASDQADC